MQNTHWIHVEILPSLGTRSYFARVATISTTDMYLTEISYYEDNFVGDNAINENYCLGGDRDWRPRVCKSHRAIT